MLLVVGLMALALSGCESIMVMTGARMRLDGVPLQSIAASMPGTGALAPGAKARLSIVATTTDGRTLATAGTGDGKVLPDSYLFEGSIVTVNADGVVKLPADPRLSEGRSPHVRIHAVGQPTPVADLDIPVRYDVVFAATYAGADGMDGRNGANGSDGADGTPGNVDLANPSAGGNGGNGGAGMNGEDGDPGVAGPDVQVTIALAPGAHPLLRVRASASRKDQFFLVDPDGGSLAITVRGGHGGRGGLAGQGGRGGFGGEGSPSGVPGTPGFEGLAGQDAPGGAAGHVAIAVDPAAAAYLDRVHVTNVDGDGRPGPAAAITVGPVVSPW
jgi:hypothetical protein